MLVTITVIVCLGMVGFVRWLHDRPTPIHALPSLQVYQTRWTDAWTIALRHDGPHNTGDYSALFQGCRWIVRKPQGW